MVFKKGGKLKAPERWKVNGQNVEVADKFSYLEVTLVNTGSWNKQKTLVKIKGYQALKAIHKCISVTPNIKAHMLENIYEMVCESKIMYGIELWGLNRAWEEADKVHSRFCKRIIGIPLCS